MRVSAQAAEPFAARRKSSCQRDPATFVPDCVAPANFGYEDRQKLTLVVEELGIAAVTHSHLGDGDVVAFVTFGAAQGHAACPMKALRCNSIAWWQ
jgi:hypothetical protein